MLYKKKDKNLRAQTLLEYVLLIGIIVMALVTMTHGIKRSVQSVVRTAADQLSNQEEADQTFNEDQGYLEFLQTNADSQSLKRIKEEIAVINYIIDTRENSRTTAQTNMGFIEEGS